MKKILQFVALCLGFAHVTNMHAQVIPNPNFENWTDLIFSQPNSWTTSNLESVPKYNVVTTKTVTGSTGLGIRMESYITATDTTFGYILYGAGGDPVNGQGGLPYTQKPDGITGYYRYNLPGNDTALMLVILKNAGTVISTDVVKVRGTGTLSAFTQFTYNLTAASSATTNPDSVIIAFASSNAIGQVAMENGSFLEIDEIAFTGTNITQPIANGSFENWNQDTINLVGGWSQGGAQVKKVPGYISPYAVSLRTLLLGGSNIAPSGITNGSFPQQGGPPFGGKPYTLMSDTLYGYYRFFGSNDSGMVHCVLKNSGSNIGGGVKYLKNATNWTFFKLHIGAGSTPDTLLLNFYSNQPPGTMNSVGSVFELDNLYLFSSPNTKLTSWTMNNQLKIYPNPSVESVIISYDDYNFNSIFVTDVTGKQLKVPVTESNSTQTTLDVRQLNQGLYFVNIKYNDKTIVKRFVKN